MAEAGEPAAGLLRGLLGFLILVQVLMLLALEFIGFGLRLGATVRCWQFSHRFGCNWRLLQSRVWPIASHLSSVNSCPRSLRAGRMWG
ncbi:hypothetical protein ACFWJM_11800 [Streptomyces sp. NPDC127077]|uniref:hypothetical protein n=1 Tax=Streptomyces sp. NPDC127077 TaxID=3347131 RepID=UPI0036665E92